MLSLLQWHQLELGLGLSREQHPGWVWDPSPRICPSLGAFQQSHLHREGAIYVYIYGEHISSLQFTGQFTTILLKSFHVWDLSWPWMERHFSARCFPALKWWELTSWMSEAMAVQRADGILLYPGVFAGDEHQKTTQQDWKTPRAVPQLPQSCQWQLGPT